MRAKMYVPIGYSSFSGEPESEEVLIAFAGRIGATAVLLSSTFTLSISFAEPRAEGLGAGVREPPSQKPLQDRFEHTAVFMVRSIAKPRFGVQMRDLRDDEQMSPSGRQGAVIDFVVEDTPASRGLLLAGDVIVTAKGVGVRNAAHFQEIIAALPNGEASLSLTLIRSGKARQVLIEF
jgi:S1-C subfamily serine protease